MTILLHITWHSVAVLLLASMSTYCILRVAGSYLDHPRIAPWIYGSEDYRAWAAESKGGAAS